VASSIILGTYRTPFPHSWHERTLPGLLLQAEDVLEAPAKRIDGGDLRRETLFTLGTLPALALHCQPVWEHRRKPPRLAA
jgi:hypothetical protein